MKRWGVLTLCVVAGVGCSDVNLDPPAEIIHARFDPDAKVIPMPSDVLRDAAGAHLDLPVDDDDLTPAEIEFYTFLNTLDGWSSTMAATIEFTGPIDPQTIDADTLQVWQWRETPARVEGVRITVHADEQKLTIDAPRTGWERGGKYFVVLRGGAAGIEGKRGEKVESDAAFYFLRLKERLDVPEHERAFPGDTRAERQDNARQLEEIRVELDPFFDFFEARGIARQEVAALWSFTITERVELAMDKASQRMPLPVNLLLDPDTHRIEIPVAEWDSHVEANAKQRLSEYDGFGTSANLLFGFTGPIDPASITADSVQLYEASNPPRLIPAELEVLDDLIHVEIRPIEQPLPEKTRFAVVVRDTVRDAEGQPIVIMPVGHFLKARAPVYTDADGSQVSAVEDEDARLVEGVRKEVTEFLADLDAPNVLSSWTFTTMSVEQPLEFWAEQPELLAVPPDPSNVVHQTPLEAAGDFPLGLVSLINVGDVYHGTIKSPVFLDPLSRGWRTDGGHELQDIPFTMTVPRRLPANEPARVVIFGHAIMTERRFVLAIADQLAARGFVAVAIDLPFHGERTYCWSEGPLSIPNPTTGELTPLDDPCQAGYTCAADGRCVDAANQGNYLSDWPIIGMHQASGAAFIEIEEIANTRDHFRQAVIDLKALARSLQKGDWAPVIGAPVDTDNLMYAGQSLGGIIGGTFVPLEPAIKRAVLNVPGADTVDMFNESPYFGTHVRAFFTREGVDQRSYEGYRFMNVARWFMDATDPMSVAHRMLDGREVLLQMAMLDFIIPNDYTKKLEQASGAPRRDYLAEHAFIVIPIEPEYLRGLGDLARFLDGAL